MSDSTIEKIEDTTPLEQLDQGNVKVSKPRHRELTHTLVYCVNTIGEKVTLDAQSCTKDSLSGLVPFIIGKDISTDKVVEEPVMLVECKDKRNYFRRYKTGHKSRNENFVLNNKENAESVLHFHVKQLLASGQIKNIRIPNAVYHRPGFTQIVEKSKLCTIAQATSEFTVHTENGDIRYDVYAQMASGEYYGIEVVVSNDISNEKKTKLKLACRDVIRVDLNPIMDKLTDALYGKEKHSVTEIIAEYLLADETNPIQIVSWANNVISNRFEMYFNSMVQFDLIKTTYKSDGDWYFWAADKKYEIKYCPHRDKLKTGTKNRRDRYLVENQCKNCKRCVSIEWNGESGKMTCNHSTVPTSDIISIIVKNTI